MSKQEKIELWKGRILALFDSYIEKYEKDHGITPNFIIVNERLYKALKIDIDLLTDSFYCETVNEFYKAQPSYKGVFIEINSKLPYNVIRITHVDQLLFDENTLIQFERYHYEDESK
jgi:hypothetical protein